MSWWSAGGNEDEVLGDDSADAVSAMLAGLKPAPTLQELLDGLAAALKSKPGFDFSKLVVTLSTNVRVESGGGGDAEIAQAVGKGLDSVIEVYQSDLERRPSLRELLENFVFVLGYDPGRFLSGIGDAEVESITSE